MKRFLHGRMTATATLFILLVAQVFTQGVFINEIHYDNDGADADEGVEIAGPAGTDLTGWSIVGYNGSGGFVFATIPLSGTIPDQQNGFGTLWFFTGALQNGPPDGIALVDAGNNVLQFISYEGFFMATDGPANGMTSTDIGVDQEPPPPIGETLQLSGTGANYMDFTWNNPAAHTMGAVNTNQTFMTTPDTEPPVWTENYPFLEKVLDTQGTLVASLDEPGTVYYVILSDGAAAPSSSQVKAGTDGNDGAALVASNFGITESNTEFRDILAGATPETPYDIYVVAEDDEAVPNLQSVPVLLEVTTGPARSLELTAPVGRETYYVGDSVTITWSSANITSVNLYAHNSPPDDATHFFAGPLPAVTGQFKTIVPLDAGVDSVYIIITDVADESLADSSDYFYLADTIRPKIYMLYPAHGSPGVPLSAYLIITFNEGVYFGTGNIVIREGDGTLFESFDVTAKIGGYLELGYKIVKIHPSIPFEKDKTYYVEIDPTALVDLQGNYFPGMSGDSHWSFSTGPDLYISEYVEGSIGSDKAIEIYNNSGITVDLSHYAFWRITNGGDWIEGKDNEVILKGELSHGDVFVVCNDQASEAIKVLSDSVGSSATFFNGDDAMGLARLVGDAWYLIDQVGTEGPDPGNGWAVAGIPDATKGHTLIRKITVLRGNTDWLASAGTDAFDSEWIVMPDGFIGNLGLPTPDASNETDIITFSLTDTLGANVAVSSLVSPGDHTVDVVVLFGTEVDSLVPVITLSKGAVVDPEAGDTVDFTNPVIFTVTAEDGLTSQEWIVTVTVAATANTQTEITRFEIDGYLAELDNEEFRVDLEMPYGTDLTSLTPVIEVSAGATIDPLSGVVRDFSSGVVYTVTAQDPAYSETWTVYVTLEVIPDVSIYEIQYTTDPSGNSSWKDKKVKTRGIVTAINIYQMQFKGYYLQDSPSAWNGLYVYDPGRDTIALGDDLTVTGTVDEYYNVTQVESVIELVEHSSGNNLPAPLDLTTGEAGAEPYEGVLITVTNATCTNADLGYGEVELNDGSGALVLDDYLYAYNPFVLNNIYTVTGVMYYSFGAYKLIPRSADDIADVTGIEQHAIGLGFSIYPNPGDGRFSLLITSESSQNIGIEIINLQGQMVFRKQFRGTPSHVEEIDISHLAKGLYFIRLSDGRSARIEKIVIR